MIDLLRPMMAAGVADAVTEALGKRWLGCGATAARFERAISTHLDLKASVLATTSGTAALEIAYELLLRERPQIGAPMVISTPVTFIATNTALVRAGARIVWADVSPSTGLIDPDSVRALCDEYGERVVGVVGVDWCGLPIDVRGLREAVGPDRWIVEDAAQGFGIRRPRWQPDATVWSFQATKHVTSIDGGALWFGYVGGMGPTLIERARRLAYFGLMTSSEMAPEDRLALDVHLGAKRHLDDVRATIGIENLQSATERLQRRRRIIEHYDGCVEPSYATSVGAVWWVYPVLVDADIALDEARKHLAACEIATSQIHARNDEHDGLTPYVVNASAPLPGVDAYRARFLALPCGPWLLDYEVERVGRALRELVRT